MKKRIVFPLFLLVLLYGGASHTIAQDKPDPGVPIEQQSDPNNPGPKVSDPNNPGPQTTGTSASEVTDMPLRIKLKNPLKVDTIQDAIKLFMDAIVKIAIPFIVVFFIWSGINFILAQGNATKMKTAKNMFWYTVIGTLLILGAWAITDAIVGTINSIAT